MALNAGSSQVLPARIDVINEADVVLGAITTVSNIVRIRRLNEVGSYSFNFSPQDPLAPQVMFGNKYDIFIKNGVFLGRGMHNTTTVQAGPSPQQVAQTDATLILLGRKFTRFGRSYSDMDAGSVAELLVNIGNDDDPYFGPVDDAKRWRCNVYDPSGTLGLVSMELQGQSILDGLTALQKLTNSNFRQVDTYTVEFGTFASGTLNRYGEFRYGEAVYLGELNTAAIYQATNVSAMMPGIESTDVLVVTGCQIIEETPTVVNRIIVLGSGDGLNQLTMQATYDSYVDHKPPNTLYSYPVKRAANPDGNGSVIFAIVTAGGLGYTTAPTVTITSVDGNGSGATAHSIIDQGVVVGILFDSHGAGYTAQPTVDITGDGAGAMAEAYISTFYYYIEDTDSMDRFQAVFEAILPESNIRPFTNSDAQIRFASDALYEAGAHYLSKHAYPWNIYSLGIMNLPPTANVGINVNFRFRGIATIDGERTKWIDVDEVVTITEIREEWTTQGLRTSIKVATNGEHETTNETIIIGMKSAINAMKVQIQPQASREIINKEREMDSTHPFEFELGIEDDVLYVDRAEIRFVTRPFRSVIQPDLADLGTIGAGTTTYFTYYGDPAAPQADWIIADNIDLRSGETTPASPYTPHFHYYRTQKHFHTLAGNILRARLSYGIFDDDAVDQNIITGMRIYMDGVLIGVGFVAGNGLTRKIDITQVLKTGSTDLRKPHHIRFECDSGRGYVEVEVKLFTAIQATLKTLNWGG